MSISDMGSQMKEMRSKMEEDEQLRVLMQGFRGSNIDESDFAMANVKMALVEVDEKDSEQLPLVRIRPSKQNKPTSAIQWVF